MSRPHIEFIFSQALEWQAESPLEGRKAAEFKLLSLDDELGELSGVIRLPSSWSGPVTSGFEEEIYVLSGDMTIDGCRLGRDGYFRTPPRIRREWATDEGVVALVMQNAYAGEGEELVSTDTTTMRWDRSGVPEELDFMDIARKTLFVDPDGRHRTWLLSVAPQIQPQGAALATETHTCAEEIFMLSGDIVGPQGVMSPGAYFWRPRDTFHGPFGSRNGGLALSRFRHGVQDTTFHSHTLPFSFDAPYRPDLPPNLAHLNRSVPATAKRF